MKYNIPVHNPHLDVAISSWYNHMNIYNIAKAGKNVRVQQSCLDVMKNIQRQFPNFFSLKEINHT
jgi:hypothetical protein